MTEPEVKVLMLKGEKGNGLSDDDMNNVKSLIASNSKALNSRIDNLIAPSGAESSAEVVDARTGYDGTKYDTLGTAIRTQVDNLENDIDNYNKYNYDNYEYSENRLYIDGLEKDKYIDRNGSDIKDYSGWALSDYLPVEKNEIYVWTFGIPAKDNVHNVYCALFDANRKYIGSGNQEDDTLENKALIKTDSNTAYVRISQDSKYFTNNAMLVRKALYDQGIKEFIPFKRYLKNSPTKEIEEKVNSFDTNYNKHNYYKYEYSENRLYIDGLEKGKYIERNGNIKDYSGWDLSDYLPVEKNEVYVWTFGVPAKDTAVNVFCGLFDVNKKYIGSGNQEDDTLENKALIKTDSNTAYVRISQDSKYFTNNAMLVRKALYDQGIEEFIPFKRYLKKSPTKEIEEKVNSFATNYQPNYDNVVRSIQRIGDGMEHPIHSLDAFKDAYRKGFRILLCDLIFTSDNVPVCYHDSYLNQTYKNVYDSNGALVSTENPVYLSQNTYATLSKYNYGAMGYPLLKFTDMLKLVKQLGVELYVEVKGMTEQQAKIACSLVRQFGLSDKTSWTGDTLEQMNWVIANLDTARVALMPSNVTDDVIAKLNSLKTGKNKVFIFGWDTTILTDEIVNKLMQNDIAFEQGTPNTEEDIENYFARGDQYYYCTGIETNAVIAGKVLLESSLSNTDIR